MVPTHRTLLPILLSLLLTACGIDAGDMNGSGYRALAFELPDEATKYFGAARDLITDEVGAGDLTTHPEYARMRAGELIVSVWEQPETAFDELRAEAARVPGLLNPKRAELLIDNWARAERLGEALAIAEFAVEQFPGEERLATRRENLRVRINGPDGSGESVPNFAPARGPAPPDADSDGV
ncbi:hypothetical protein [Engelhardtia mirabilis]|uniref:Tetratricopeptide repeat protein n=1 Tax=Engelhardtia mirabilis TaxID=2528011 RepID=A0A518BFS5_9BACT|nr:hypothetical protein Pla133_08970 [Planctomycetes bacterium Pla133]QDV00157.1 hypothetical protein Pla86_08960 [Planctomycetes bacterium Pla86]